MTSLIGAAELLEDADEADRQELIGTIQHSSRRLQELLDALRRLAVAREPVGRGPSRISEGMTRLERPDGLELKLEGDAELPVDAEALAAVLGHLAGNAAAHGADRLDIVAEPGGFTAQDNGSGIASGNRDRVFDPFFTTRRSAGGTGMGLAIVRTMLQAVGGEITLEPSEAGARFRVGF